MMENRFHSMLVELGSTPPPSPPSTDSPPTSPRKKFTLSEPTIVFLLKLRLKMDPQRLKMNQNGLKVD